MAKNIVVCCDGTANEFSKNRTNVAKLFYVLQKGSPGQTCYYHPGVGTMAPTGMRTGPWARVQQLAGAAFGYGLAQDVRDLYVYIANTFEPGDKLFLFGFSRGAYTVRAAASLLRLYGLVEPGNDPLVPYIVRMLWAIRALEGAGSPAEPSLLADYFGLADDFKATYSAACRPHFVGVWDTVSSVGWFANPVSLPNTADNGDIGIARHAVAIDERRAFFRTNLWRPRLDEAGAGPRNLRQVWFPGVHCDVGGGYPEAESGLSKLALEWMIQEGREAGLAVDDAKVARVLGQAGGGYVAPDPDGPMHDSLAGWWKPVEYIPRPRWNEKSKETEWRANRGLQRRMPDYACCHDAAWARGGDYAARLPQGAVKLSQATWQV